MKILYAACTENWPADDELVCYKHVEGSNWNKLMRKKCAPSRFFPTYDLTALLSDPKYIGDTECVTLPCV